MDFHFNTAVTGIEKREGGYTVHAGGESYECKECVVSVGRSGSKWLEGVCKSSTSPQSPTASTSACASSFRRRYSPHLTDELYESKIVYRTEKFEDLVRTFCMNPKGAVVTENTNGIVTVNGHSYEDPAKQTENTNFALLVSKHYRALQGLQRLRRVYCTAFQHARRRRHGPALRRSHPRPPQHRSAG